MKYKIALKNSDEGYAVSVPGLLARLSMHTLQRISTIAKDSYGHA
jgi:hypothetical protein